MLCISCFSAFLVTIYVNGYVNKEDFCSMLSYLRESFVINMSTTSREVTEFCIKILLWKSKVSLISHDKACVGFQPNLSPESKFRELNQDCQKPQISRTAARRVIDPFALPPPIHAPAAAAHKKCGVWILKSETGASGVGQGTPVADCQMKFRHRAKQSTQIM